MKQKIDYALLEKEYMTSNISITSLAKKHKLVVSTIARYADKNNWQQKRNEIRENATKRAIERTTERQVDAWVEMKEKMLHMMSGVIERYEANPEASVEKASSIIRAVKDMREMGVFGSTVAEDKTRAEIEKLRKEISDDGSKDITVRVISDDVESYGE